MTYRTARRLTVALLTLVTIAVLLMVVAIGGDDPSNEAPTAEVDKLSGTPHRQLVALKPAPLPGCELDSWMVSSDHKTVTVWDRCPGSDRPILRPGRRLWKQDARHATAGNL